MKCKRCGRDILENEQYEYLGEMLCEDCYINIRSSAKVCDPWAVYSTDKSRDTLRLKRSGGMATLRHQ